MNEHVRYHLQSRNNKFMLLVPGLKKNQLSMATAQAACIERKHSNNESNGLKSPDKDFLCAN